jgi:hypothetical protein
MSSKIIRRCASPLSGRPIGRSATKPIAVRSVVAERLDGRTTNRFDGAALPKCTGILRVSFAEIASQRAVSD